MEQFRTAVFGGYRKEEVDEYVANLVAQMEQMKKTLEEHARQLAGAQAEHASKEKEYQEKVAALEEKLRGQDGKYDALNRIIVMAEQEARSITDKAHTQADEYRRQAEAELLAQKRAADEECTKARQQAARYMDAVSETKDKLAGLYASLGALIQNMSASIPARDKYFRQETAEEEDRLGEYGIHIIDMDQKRTSSF